MSIDTSKIEGYADMTPEQKVAALEALELPKPDYSGYVSKETFDKTASELAAAKKKALEQLSEDDRKKQERDNELESLRAECESLKKQSTIAKFKASCIGMGYDEELAQKTAEALANGEADKVLELQATFADAYAKRVRAGMLGSVTTPPAGSGTKSLTKEEIMAIKDTAERQRAIAAHHELFQ